MASSGSCEGIDTRKISADAVTYGRGISGGRDFVWGAYDNGVPVAVGATAPRQGASTVRRNGETHADLD